MPKDLENSNTSDNTSTDTDTQPNNDKTDSSDDEVIELADTNENEDENAYLNDYNTDRELDSYANQLLAMKRRSNFRNTNDRAPDLTNEEIDRLEDGEQVTSEIDNSVYAASF